MGASSTDTGPPGAEVLQDAAAQAGQAPSILNTQPWRWRIHGRVLELSADRDRQLHSLDPDGRLLILSCGAALHHARVALAAAGHEPEVTRHPDQDDPDLLARIQLTGARPIAWDDIHLRRSIGRRRSDRRPFPATRAVPAQTTAALHKVAEAEHAWLHRVEPDQQVFLRAAAEVAQRHQQQDEQYQQELRSWTRRQRASGEGVPADTYVTAVSRPVPLRDFAQGGEVMLHPGSGDDRYADYLLVVTEADGPTDWLAAGEATSAVWLTATSRELAVSVLSDVVEVPAARSRLRGLLHRPGFPQLVLRLAFDVQPAPPKASPRRRPDDILDRDNVDHSE